MTDSHRNRGFTIVELLVVIVIIGILAAITIVSYSGISKQATVASLKSDLTNSVKQLKLFMVEYGQYPQTLNTTTNCSSLPVDTKYCLKPSNGTTYDYTAGSAPYKTFTLKATKSGLSYVITEDSSAVAYTAPTAVTIQTPTAAFNGSQGSCIALDSYGGSGENMVDMYLGDSNWSSARAGNILFYFDLSSVPTTATITKADLVVYQSTGMTGTTTVIADKIYAYRMLKSWTAANSWYNAWWSVAGGEGVGTDRASSYTTSVDFSTAAGLRTGWKRFDLKGDVQAIANGTNVNRGWMITAPILNWGTYTNIDGQSVITMSGPGSASNKPYLDLEYTTS